MPLLKKYMKSNYGYEDFGRGKNKTSKKSIEEL